MILPTFAILRRGAATTRDAAIGPLANPERTICMIDQPALDGSETHLVTCHFAGSRAAAQQVSVN